MVHPRRTLSLVVAVVLVVVACGDDIDSDSPSRPPSTTTTTLSPEHQVEQAYLAFAEMGARLLQDPDPDDPEIDQRASGEARENLIAGLTTLQANNQHYTLGPHYGHDVLSVDVTGNEATLQVCVVDDVKLISDSSGEQLGAGTTTAFWSVTMLRASGSWRADAVAEQEIGEGVLECT